MFVMISRPHFVRNKSTLAILNSDLIEFYFVRLQLLFVVLCLHGTKFLEHQRDSLAYQ